VIVGTDRTTYTGDVANKIGTYLKALAARDNASRSMWPCPPRLSIGTAVTA
jgi:methylthioribose-1-phosphate isomerase